jgi:predicted kinase
VLRYQVPGFETLSAKQKELAYYLYEAALCGRDIIWDQTSTTIKSRTKKFLMLPDYHAIAVVFKPPSTKELEFRLNNRPGKIVPKHVVQSMIDNWEEPTIEEGFKDIWYV